MNLDESRYKSLMKSLIEGNVKASAGEIGGWSLTKSAIYRRSSNFGDTDGMYFGADGLSIKDRFMVSAAGDLTAHRAVLYGNDENVKITIGDNINMSNSISDSFDYLLRISNYYFTDQGKKEVRMSFTGDAIAMWDAYNNKTVSLFNSAGSLHLTAPDWIEINSPQLNITGVIYPEKRVVLPNNTALRGLDTNGDEKNLIYLSTNDNVIINGNGSGVTRILSGTEITGDLTVSGNIRSTGGYLSSNNCTSPTGGISGGYINANGRCVLVGADSSNYPQVVFVTNKSTSRSTTLRSNNASGSYTLTLPNSTGTLAVSSSDVRLKENIKPSEVSGLELIEKVKLHEFDWKPEAREGASHWKIGMIADELEELDKNLTFGGGENEDGSMNVKGIDTTCMLAYLVKAVQELNERTKEAAA